MTPNLATVGRIISVHGVKGWVKVFSHTDPKTQIFDYQPWYLLTPSGSKKIKLLQWKPQGKSLIAYIDGIEDRNQALQLVGFELAVPDDVLPVSDGDTYYWRDLIGLRVVNQQGVDFGIIAEMLATGANDVMRVEADNNSVDKRERLVPWLPDDVVIEVDLKSRRLQVEWDADF